MDHELRCNSTPCRRLLTGADSPAVVTTCSHIFCPPCAEQLFTDARVCPACETSLPDPDDIVRTSLKPTQSYKSTILAGMDPMTIHDICGRSLGFWTYQMAQEISFQNMILKDAQERASIMEREISNMVREANTKVLHLQDKIHELQKELDHVMRKNRELADSNKETSKEYMKLRTQYEKFMGKNMPAASVARGGTDFLSNGAISAGVRSKKTYQLDSKEYGGQTTGNMSRGVTAVGATPSRAFHPNSTMSSTNQRRSLPLNAHPPSFIVNPLASAHYPGGAHEPVYPSLNAGSASGVTRQNGIENRHDHQMHLPFAARTKANQAVTGSRAPSANRLLPGGIGQMNAGTSATFKFPVRAGTQNRKQAW